MNFSSEESESVGECIVDENVTRLSLAQRRVVLSFFLSDLPSEVSWNWNNTMWRLNSPPPLCRTDLALGAKDGRKGDTKISYNAESCVNRIASKTTLSRRAGIDSK